MIRSYDKKIGLLLVSFIFVILFSLNFVSALPFAKIKQIGETKDLELIFNSALLNEKFRNKINEVYDDMRTPIKPQLTEDGVKFVFFGDPEKGYAYIYEPLSREKFREDIVSELTSDTETRNKIIYLIDKVNGLIGEIAKETKVGTGDNDTFIQHIYKPIVLDDNLTPISGEMAYYCCNNNEIRKGRIGKIGDLFSVPPYPKADNVIVSNVDIYFHRTKDGYYDIKPKPYGLIGIKTKKQGYMVFQALYSSSLSKISAGDKLIRYKDLDSEVKFYLKDYMANVFYVNDYRKIPDVEDLNNIKIYCGENDEYDKAIQKEFPKLWNKYSAQLEKCTITTEKNNPCIIKGLFKLVKPRPDLGENKYIAGIIIPSERIDVCNNEIIEQEGERIKLGLLVDPKMRKDYSMFNLGNKEYFNPKAGGHLPSFTSADGAVKIETVNGNRIIEENNIKIIQPSSFTSAKYFISQVS